MNLSFNCGRGRSLKSCASPGTLVLALIGVMDRKKGLLLSVKPGTGNGVPPVVRRHLLRVKR